MIPEIIITTILFFLSVSLSFISVDIAAISSIYLALRFGVIYGIFLSFSKPVAGLIRRKIDHRTIIHLVGILVVISVGTLVHLDSLFYPVLLFLSYLLITFPVIQYLGGDLFRGMLYNFKDFIIAIIFLWLARMV